MSRHHRALAPSRAALAALALLGGLAQGCATTGAAPKGDVVWPLPPDPPRIRYLGSFNQPEHLSRSGLRAFFDALLPRDSGAAIRSPTGLALSPDEKVLYVACGPASRVVAVNLEAGTMKPVANAANHAPAFPQGVAVDAENRLYVSDRVQAVVWVYDADGKFLRRFGEGKLTAPSALSIDRRRQLLYVLAGTDAKENHRVEVFSLAGEHLRTIGKRGAAPGEFNYPVHSTLGPDGSLYVADMLNFRIQVFSPEGELSGLFGQIGVGAPGAFDKAKGVALDAFGNIYVVDALQGVQMFNARYQPLMSFAGSRFMKVPGPIVIDSRNRIFIADYGQNGIHRFELVNTKPEDSFAEPEPVKAAEPGAAAPAPGTPAPSAPGEPAAPSKPD